MKLQIEIAGLTEDAASFAQLNERLNTVAMEELAKLKIGDPLDIRIGDLQLDDRKFIFGIVINRP